MTDGKAEQALRQAINGAVTRVKAQADALYIASLSDESYDAARERIEKALAAFTNEITREPLALDAFAPRQPAA